MDLLRAIKRLADTAEEQAADARKSKNIDAEIYHLAKAHAYRECFGLAVYVDNLRQKQ